MAVFSGDKYKKASSDAAYSIQEQNERKSVEIATADADLAKQEKAVEIIPVILSGDM